jgi:hypothetical protein
MVTPVSGLVPPAAAGFADGAKAHLDAFLETVADPARTIVKARISTGEEFYSHGLRVVRNASPACIMIHGDSNTPPEAWVVREDDLVSVMFLTEADSGDDSRPGSFGLAAYAERLRQQAGG